MNNRDDMTRYLTREQYDMYIFLVAFMSVNWFENLHWSAMTQVSYITVISYLDSIVQCSKIILWHTPFLIKIGIKKLRLNFSREGFVKLHTDLMEEVIQLEFSEYDK